MRDFKSFFVAYTLGSVSKFRGLNSVGFANLLSQLAAEHMTRAAGRMRCSS